MHNERSQPNKSKKQTITFNPHILARNAHIQTIFSSYPRYQANGLLAASQEMLLEVGDGTRLQGKRCYRVDSILRLSSRFVRRHSE
jgi:hypothetical protein